MIINGQHLLDAAPISYMQVAKRIYKGTSYGLSEAGYDIRIKQQIAFNYSKNAGPQIIVEDEGEKTFYSGRFVLASSIEKFQMPPNLLGLVKDKSSWARRGLSLFNTVIEPQWNGYLTLELVFNGNAPFTIRPGQGIAQVIFQSLIEDGDYGTGKYQNAANHPQTVIS